MGELVISISGDCDVSNIINCKSMIARVLEGSQSIAVDCRNIDRADISFIQLIAAAQAAFDGSGLGFRLANAGETLRTAIERSGFRFSTEAGRISTGQL